MTELIHPLACDECLGYPCVEGCHMKWHLDTLRHNTRLVSALRWLLQDVEHRGCIPAEWKCSTDDVVFDLAGRLGWNDPAEQWARMTPK